MHPKSLSNPVRAAIFAVASAALVYAPLRLPAQAAPKGPNGLPDIVGLYPGMPVSDAYNLLKGYFPTRGGKVDAYQETIQGLNSDKPLVTKLHIPPKAQQDTYDDAIDVAITLPPNKQVVWAVNRTISFEPGKAPSVSALVQGLRQKYGPEIYELYETRAVSPTLKWVFDRQGKRVPDEFARRCPMASGSLISSDGGTSHLIYNPSDIANGALTNPGPGNDACKRSVVMMADLPSDLNGVARGFTIYIMDLGLAIDAGYRTEAVIRGVDNAEQQQAQQQQKKIDKKAVPSF